MKKIPLTQGQFALVDDEDFEYLNQFKWHAVKSATCSRETFYAHSSKCGLMHRMIMNAQKGETIDHQDHDGLNNQKTNLRKATKSQNQWNRLPNKKSISPYKGVILDKRFPERPYRAHIFFNATHRQLGRYDTAEDAARAYDVKAKEIFGEFAYQNFPESDFK